MTNTSGVAPLPPSSAPEPPQRLASAPRPSVGSAAGQLILVPHPEEPRGLQSPARRTPQRSEAAYREALRNDPAAARQRTKNRILREDQPDMLRHAVDRMATRKNVGWFATWRSKADRHWVRDDYQRGDWQGRKIASDGAGSQAKYGLKGSSASPSAPTASDAKRALLLQVVTEADGQVDARASVATGLEELASRIDADHEGDLGAWRTRPSDPQGGAARGPDDPAAFLIQTRSDMHRLRATVKDSLIVANMQLDALRAAERSRDVAPEQILDDAAPDEAAYGEQLEAIIADLMQIESSVSDTLQECDRLLASDDLARLADPSGAESADDASELRERVAGEIEKSFGVRMDAFERSAADPRTDLALLAAAAKDVGKRLGAAVSEDAEPLAVRDVLDGIRASAAPRTSAETDDYEHGAKRNVLSALRKAFGANRKTRAGGLARPPVEAMFAEADASGLAGHYENRCRELIGVRTLSLRQRVERGELDRNSLDLDKTMIETAGGFRSLGRHLDRMAGLGKEIALRRMHEDIERHTADLDEEEAFLHENLSAAQQRLGVDRLSKSDDRVLSPAEIRDRSDIREISRRLGAIGRERLELSQAKGRLAANAQEAGVKDVDGLPSLDDLAADYGRDLAALELNMKPRIEAQAARGGRQQRNAEAFEAELTTLKDLCRGLRDEVATVRRDDELGDATGLVRYPQFRGKTGRTLRASDAEAKALKEDLDAEVKAGNWERKIGRKWYQTAAHGLRKVFGFSVGNKNVTGTTKTLFKGVANTTHSAVLVEERAAEDLVEMLEETRESAEGLSGGQGELVDPAEIGDAPGSEGQSDFQQDIDGAHRAANIEEKAVADAQAKEMAVLVSTEIEAVAGFLTSGLKLHGHLSDIKHKKDGIKFGEDLLVRHKKSLGAIKDDRARSDARYENKISQFFAERLTDQEFNSDMVKAGVSALSMARYADKALKPVYQSAIASTAGSVNPFIGAATNGVDMVFAAHDAKKAFVSKKKINDGAKLQRESFRNLLQDQGIDTKGCFGWFHGKPNWKKIEKQIAKTDLGEDAARYVQDGKQALAQTEMLVHLAEDGGKLGRKLCLFGAKSVTTGAYGVSGGLIVAGAAGGITILGPVGGGIAAGVALTYFTGVQIAKNGEKYREAVGREAIAGASNPARLAKLQDESVKRGMAGNLEEAALHLASLRDPTLKSAEIVSKIKHAAHTQRRVDDPAKTLMPTEEEKAERAEQHMVIEHCTQQKDALNAEWRAAHYPEELDAWRATNDGRMPRSEAVLASKMDDEVDALHLAVSNLQELNGALAGRIAAATDEGQLLFASGQVPAEVFLAIAEAPPQQDETCAQVLADLMR